MKTSIVYYSLLFTISLSAMLSTTAISQANYDESKIPSYDLPALLTATDGNIIANKKDWEKQRKAEILSLFEEHVYGKYPQGNLDINFQVVKNIPNALNGKAILKEVKITLSNNKGSQAFDLLIYLPAKSTKPTPIFLGMNFYGNHTIHNDPAISLAKSWVRNNEDYHITENKATEASRGVRASRWPVEQIIERGYGVAAIYYGDIDPDYDDGFQNGIQPLFYKDGQVKPKDNEWGSITAWAFGLSRAMDYFKKDKGIDSKKVAVIGHSRLGKAALWAGVTDERFSMVISNDSGCGGAALSRRRIGETVERINSKFPHWFNENFNKYNGNEDALPVDQHMLLGLVAPRPLYVASASKDEWADPKGEYLSLYHSREVYSLYDNDVINDKKQPAVDTPVMKGKMGYHLRTGKHDITIYDWTQYMNFADMQYKK